MSVVFAYGDVSSVPGIVTRTVSVSTNPETLPNYFTAFQLTLDFDPAMIDIIDWEVAASDSQSIQATNPLTPELASDSGNFRMSGVSLTGIAPGTSFLTLTYSHAAAANPSLEFSNVVIDETIALASPIISTYTNPNQTAVDTGLPTETQTIASVIDIANGLYLYAFADGTAGFSSVVASAGDELDTVNIVVLKLSTNNPVDINAVFASGLVSISLTQVGTDGVVDLEFSDGTTSSLAFDTASGLLTESSSSSGDTDTNPVTGTDSGVTDQVSPTVPDGVNLGSGTTDAQGIEISASEIEDYFDAPSDALVIYRQRLDDAVAYEAMKTDGSLTGKFVGDADSRTVAMIDTGSLNFVVDTPSGVDLDFFGIAGNASTSRAATYLNGMVDDAIGNSAELASWGASIKSSVSKMTQAHVGENVDMKVIMPSRQISGTDEIAISAQSSSNNVAAVVLSGVEDLITTTGFDSLIAVGPGRLMVSGSTAANVFGDSLGQEIVGGSGDDLISGGGGSDVLTGGSGQDTFEVGFDGTTVISDLAGEDSLQFSLFGVGDMASLAARVVGVGQGTQGLLIQFDNFAIELVGYNDLSQFTSGITFG